MKGAKERSKFSDMNSKNSNWFHSIEIEHQSSAMHIFQFISVQRETILSNRLETAEKALILNVKIHLRSTHTSYQVFCVKQFKCINVHSLDRDVQRRRSKIHLIVFQSKRWKHIIHSLYSHWYRFLFNANGRLIYIYRFFGLINVEQPLLHIHTQLVFHIDWNETEE